ncbi:uncharacterized protein N7479_006543 [Penicillium vulpinum]|uniref:Cysteine-rich secreted protein n=1 Tax=Penicillium vulpinum TaxID=29845 RepID=A0A1V6S287_9EURO|nr:uncharacterized protein N7479_006543 [Penicillium vulpinum]KAJ5959393.1 hypothetical protein N7479_006543 [Penicillium vulpinum]OQE07978.1 hypothetical protein PENVUL_c011G06930 [Penicillium vulpinum]
MKRSSISYLALFLQLQTAYGYKVNVRDIPPDADIIGNGVWWGTGMPRDGFQCSPAFPLSISADKTVATCCLPGNSLKGSKDTEWHCCADGHDLTGSKDNGYQCCADGREWNGTECKEKTCPNGKVLVNGVCQCPDGTVEGTDGTCKPPPQCTSGLTTGKCYGFVGTKGLPLAFNEGQYSERAPGKYPWVTPGKFQLCRDENCASGLPVNPGTEVYIKDLHSSREPGNDAGQWLNNNQNGAHITKTPNFLNAGKFTFTKWPCGKYCIAGLEAGLLQACPDANPGLTFSQQDPEACLEYEITEVPCSIREESNNCIWKTGANQCCGKMEC